MGCALGFMGCAPMNMSILGVLVVAFCVYYIWYGLVVCLPNVVGACVRVVFVFVVAFSVLVRWSFFVFLVFFRSFGVVFRERRCGILMVRL